MASVVEVFPRRPIKLAPDPKRRKRRLMILLLAVLLAFYPLWWQYGILQESRLRANLRDHGVRAEETRQTGGTCTSRRGRLSGEETAIGCEIEISYVVRAEHGGGTREAMLHHEGREPIFTPSAVYDPADPSRVMLAPEVERALTKSQLFGPLFLLIPAIIALLVFLFSNRRALARAAADPEPMIVPIRKVVRAPGRLYLNTQAPHETRETVTTFRTPEQPLVVPSPPEAPLDQQRVLALKSGDRHLPLDAGLAWLELTDEERRAVLNAARGY